MNSPRNPVTPPREILLKKALSPLQQDLITRKNIKKSQHCILWGTANLIILAVILSDLCFTCRIEPTYLYYVEYAILTICGLNCVHYSIKYAKIYAGNKKPHVPKVDNRFKSSGIHDPNVTYQNVVTNTISNSPRDKSNSWLNASFNTSQNQSIPSWSIQSFSPQQNLTPKCRTSPLASPKLNNMELNNEKSIHEYVKEYASIESSNNLNAQEPTNLLSLFWNHPSTKINKDSSPMLQRCQYQLSTPTSATNSPKSDDKASPLNIGSQGLDTWRRLNVDSVALTQWNENLRIWISQTILCRLIKEFESINKSFQAHGLSDISIGNVGLDRLRKTAQGPILQTIPNLPTIVPFLELHANQEYLVKRIRELAKGGCMSEYRWNGGSSYNGKDWDITLPTDAAIIMHMTASYLDTQLLPLPNKPDIKPFTGFHFIKSTEKLPELTDKTLAIHEVSVNPPHYRVIIEMTTYEMVKGYNNLFHSILLFLYYVNQKEHGMLGRINLGRAGVNMLWIIQSN